MQHKKELLNQSQIADRLGVNRSTISRYIREHSVAPQQIKGRQKFYDATILQQYKKEIKKNSISSDRDLLKQIAQQQEEIENLKRQIKEKDEIIINNDESLFKLSLNNDFLKDLVKQQREEIAELRNQVKEKDEIVKSNNKDLVEISKQLTKLTSQAQQLNLLDKPKKIEDSEENVVVKNETETTTATRKKHWWSIFR